MCIGIRPGQADTVRDIVHERLAGRFVPLETERAVAAGLFGPEEPTPELRGRLGDLLLLAQDGSRLVTPGETMVMNGHHGSLTPEEMLVPLFMVRLDA